MGRRLQDLTGQKFGQLTVVERAGYLRGRSAWLCKCECGNTTVATGNSLKTLGKISCGCFLLKRLKEIRTTHGKSGSRIYFTWQSMRRRCESPKAEFYYRYGGRGIKVCERWNTFENFFEDMGDPPGPKYSLDRIDPDGNYEPGNCRWATPEEQANNKTNNHIVEFNGESMTISQWASKLGIKYHALLLRLTRYGWPVEKALTTPSGTRHRESRKGRADAIIKPEPAD